MELQNALLTKQQKHIRDQLKNSIILEKYHNRIKSGNYNINEINQALKDLADTDFTIVAKDYIHLYTNWISNRKTLLQTWIKIEREKISLQNENASMSSVKTLESFIEEDIENKFKKIVRSLGFSIEVYKYSEIAKRTERELSELFRPVQEVRLTPDEQRIYDPFESELKKYSESMRSRNNVTNIEAANVTINNYFSSSRESIDQILKPVKDIKEKDKKLIKKYLSKQNRRAENIRFLNTAVRDFQSKNITKEELKILIKNEKSIRTKSKVLIEILGEINIDNQIASLLRQWILLERSVILLRTQGGCFEKKILANRYYNIFGPILKEGLNDKFILDELYIQATSNVPTRKDMVLEPSNKIAFRSIEDFSCITTIQVTTTFDRQSLDQSLNSTLSTNTCEDSIRSFAMPFQINHLEELGLTGSRRKKAFCTII